MAPVDSETIRKLDEMMTGLKTLAKELRCAELALRKTKHAVARETGHYQSFKKRKEQQRELTPDFAEFAGQTHMSEDEAMMAVARYISDNALISETDPTKIILDRKMKLLLGLNRFHEPNTTYAFIRKNIENAFMSNK